MVKAVNIKKEVLAKGASKRSSANHGKGHLAKQKEVL